MVKAASVISHCQDQTQVWLWKDFLYWVKGFDWVDPFHTFLADNSWKMLSGKARTDLYNDAFWWSIPGVWRFHKPWVWTNIMDIETDSYYIARDPNGEILRDAEWNALYKYHDTWELVKWEDIKDKTERVFYFFSRKSKQMIAAPSWWPGVRKMLEQYVQFIREEFPKLMTRNEFPDPKNPDWFQRLLDDTMDFIHNIENGKWKQWWYNIIYNLFTTPRGNHWYFMSEILKGNTFDRILSDPEVARNMLGYDFSKVDFRDFSEAVAVYAGTARWWNITVVDVLWRKYADKIYGKEWLQLFDIDENWKVTRSKDPQLRHMSKTYFMKLNVKQQIEQIKQMLWSDAPSMEKFRDLTRAKIWWYNGWWYILRWISFIWQPWFYSALMSFGKWLTWFMPLLVLNSWMFVTDALAWWTKLSWNWKHFFRKWKLADWLPDNVEWYSNWLGMTLADMARKWAQKTIDAVNQWLFNVNDMIMENSYRVRQYQRFFESQFPGLKSVEDIDRELQAMMDRQMRWDIPQWTVERLLSNAREYAEYSIRNQTTNTPVIASLARVHPAKNPYNQPMKDTFYTLWHFFAWWWYNKISWAWKIVKTWLFDNIYHWKIWSNYLDQLLKEGDIAEVNAKMTRTYLENEDLLYFVHKVYTAFIIAKYLDRLTEWSTEKNEQNIFDDYKDLVDFFDVFSWEYAAIWATPQGRLIKNFFDNFIWELQNDAWFWVATQAWLAATTKEVFRSMFRKLYIPQIWVEAAALVNKDWDTWEIDWIKIAKDSIQDNVNGYLFYLKDKTENWEFSYYIPKWPNAYVNSILWINNWESNYINRQKTLSKYANLFNSEQWLLELTEEQKNNWDWINTSHPFVNWILYSFPFLKQWNISQLDEVEWFIDDLDAFRRTAWYQAMTNNKMPNDMTNWDWDYLYRLVTGRLINDKEKIDNTDIKWYYSFLNDYWEVTYDKTKQAQENLLNLLMNSWLTEAEASKFTKMMDWKTDDYDEEAIRTLAYIEAKTPGSSLQALAYLMNKEMLRYTFRSGIYYDDNDPESQKLKKDMMAKWSIEAAKKYAKYLPEIDRYRTWPQFILYYAKTHDTSLAKYISGPGENNAKTMKLITPGAKEGPNGVIYQNKILKQNFQAQLMVDIYWAMWDPDARKLMNWYSLIFETNKYENKDWTLNPKYAAYALNQLESVYNHIDWLWLDENTIHKLKQWTLMFWDKLLPNIINDEKLMARDDVRQIVNDWTSYWYKEFRELDQIAIEAAEDQLQNDEYKSRWAKKNYLNWWASKKFSWFTNWYDYMKNRAYSNYYTKYRVFDWTPRSWQTNYLSEWEFEQARKAQNNFMYHGENPNTAAKKAWWSKSQDDTIGVSTRRGKAIQFYKREDPDKPVEYKIPWRKRWVRRWSGVQPISTTTWKHLTPTPKK